MLITFIKFIRQLRFNFFNAKIKNDHILAYVSEDIQLLTSV